jgi:tetratricopeptide (TPR) repeat protein
MVKAKLKKYEEAIAAYREHIAERAAVSDRPEWENPYIYLLDIGDIYLQQGNVEQALTTYESAAEHDVKAGYVNDRLRYIASWYEEHGELEKAIEHLQKYRERDELLFDLMLNRLARQLVAREEAQEAETESPTAESSAPPAPQLRIIPAWPTTPRQH